MGTRPIIASCLVFSGLSALVYQVIWTRLLGFAFGTTTEAIGTVLAVFFGGLALGNWLAARALAGVGRPLRVYAMLELGIGCFALASLPLLANLGWLYGWVGVDHGPWAMRGIRVLAAAALLLPPTIAMGATLPIVARGTIASDAEVGRWSGILYTANTLGAVLGAYLCGFWLIPFLGLTKSILLSAGLNFAVAAVTWRIPLPGTLARTDTPPVRANPVPEAVGSRLLICLFGLSGFAAIGFEIIWTKLFGIVMQGTLYGFSTVLSVYLLGIALGSLLISPWVDRIRNLTTTFGLLHIAIATTVALGVIAVPYLPYGFQRIQAMPVAVDTIHRFFILVAPIILLPTILFGAAFPILIRLYTGNAEGVGRSMGIAIAVNTCGSILGSLAVSFWWATSFGIDATALLLVVIEFCIGLTALLAFGSERPVRRLLNIGAAACLLLAVAGGFGGVHLDRAIVGRDILDARNLLGYQRELERRLGEVMFLHEGRNMISTVHQSSTGRRLANNGLREAGVSYAPPYDSLVTSLLGILPYLAAPEPEHALVIGLGGARTVDAILHTRIRSVDVVELEEGVAAAVAALYQGLRNPLDDSRVHLILNDARNELLKGVYRGGPRYDLIASQPSHPWLAGVANLFTEDFFEIVRQSLTEGGVFALWVNGFRTDRESLIAIMASFERVFPGSMLLSAELDLPHQSVLLLGARGELKLDLARVDERLREPGVQDLLGGLFEIRTAWDVLALFEAPTRAFVAQHPDAANTDDNAFVETRIPRRVRWELLDFSTVYGELPDDARVLPTLVGEPDLEAIVRALIRPELREDQVSLRLARMRRFLRVHGSGIDPDFSAAALGELGLMSPATAAEAIRTLSALLKRSPEKTQAARILGRYMRGEGKYSEAERLFGLAHERSGSGRDAFEMARAIFERDHEEAYAVIYRISRPERAELPALAFYYAVRALEQGRRGEELQPFYTALLDFRHTEEGRSFPEIYAVLAELAHGLGNRRLARTHWEMDLELRRQATASDALQLKTALDAGDLDAARAHLERMEKTAPQDLNFFALKALLALRDGDEPALHRALEALRDASPDLKAAVRKENGFRVRHDLPRLPLVSLKQLNAHRWPNDHAEEGRARP